MPLPRLFATGLWLAVIAASTGVVWMATSTVAADVTDRPPSVLAHDDVVDQLESASPSATTTTSIASKVERPPSTVPSRGSVPVPASQPSVPDAPTPPTLPSEIETALVPPPATEMTEPTAPPEMRPANPPTSPTTAPRPTATYSTSGGVVRVACNGLLIELVSAIPSNGYAVNVVADGPGNVDVHFVGRDGDLSVKAVCFGQPIRYYDQSPPPTQAQDRSEP